MAVIVEDGRLTLTGYVGVPTFEVDGVIIFDGFTHPEVVEALTQIGDDTELTVHINSGGGYANEGSAIRAALVNRKGRTDVVIDGIAASAATIIAMAGETVSMSLGSLMMIHDPSGWTDGTIEDHEQTIKGLKSLAGTYARVYARKSGKTDAECRAIMRAVTWYEPLEAVEAGFADEALEEDGGEIAAFPYQHYANAPDRLVALAEGNGWRSPVPAMVATATRNAPKPQKETPRMAIKPKAAGSTPANPAPAQAAIPEPDPAQSAAPVQGEPTAADVKARIKAITEDPAATGHETLARHLAFDTDMPAAEAVAALKASASDAPAPDCDAANPAVYQASRSAAADLAAPTGGKPVKAKATIDTGAIYAARRA